MRITIPATALLLCLICSAALATQSVGTQAPLPLPKSITALAAIHRARIAIAHARQVCREAIAAARRREAQQLKLAEQHAMHRTNLKDAVLISKWAKGAGTSEAGSPIGRWENRGVIVDLCPMNDVRRSDHPGVCGKWYRLAGSPGYFVVLYGGGTIIDMCRLGRGGRSFTDANATLSRPWTVRRQR